MKKKLWIIAVVAILIVAVLASLAACGNLFSKNEAIRDLLQTIFTKWGVIAEDEVVEERIAKAV